MRGLRPRQGEGPEGNSHGPDRRRLAPGARQQPTGKAVKELDVWFVLRAGEGSPGFLLSMV